MREVIEDTGDELAKLLEEMEQRRHRRYPNASQRVKVALTAASAHG